MTKAKKICLASGIIGALIVFSIGVLLMVQANKVPEMKYNFSYLNIYDSFDEVYQAADNVLVGKPVSMYSYKLHDVVFTDVHVQVAENVKGDTTDSYIDITYTGGLFEGVNYVAEEIVIPPVNGDTYLFLTTGVDEHTGKRYALNSFQGTYKLNYNANTTTFAQSNAQILRFNPQNKIENELLQSNSSIVNIVESLQ